MGHQVYISCGYTPSLSEAVIPIEKAGLIVTDIEVLNFIMPTHLDIGKKIALTIKIKL
jgi:cyclopropane-fatty-acyl-phospholipid synthase